MSTFFKKYKYKMNQNFINKARTIKRKEDILDSRVLEKFEIERRYWEKQDISWGIVTEEEIDKVLAKNISYYYELNDIIVTRGFINENE
ncbi:TnsA endonuclease N-terminal domain-containing protein [Clostridium sp. Marseille-Q7071]